MEKVKISSSQDKKGIIHILVEKINELEAEDQALKTEIVQLRTDMNERLTEMNSKMDENTLAVKALGQTLESLDGTMKDGLDNLGKILQEMSNKVNPNGGK